MNTNYNLEVVEGMVNDEVDGDPVEIPESLAWVFEGFLPFNPEAIDEAEAEDIRKAVERWTKYNRLDQTEKERGVLPVNLGGGISLVAVVEPVDGRIAIVMRRLMEQQQLSEGKTFNVYDIIATRPMDTAEEARKLITEVSKAYLRRVTGKITGFGVTRDERMAAAEVTPEAKASKALG